MGEGNAILSLSLSLLLSLKRTQKYHSTFQEILSVTFFLTRRTLLDRLVDCYLIYSFIFKDDLIIILSFYLSYGRHQL